MSIVDGGARGTGAAFNSGNTLNVPITSGLVILADEVALLAISSTNTSTADGDNSEVSSVVDTASNGWTKLGEWTNANGSADAGVTVSLWQSRLTATLDGDAGANITVNFASNRTDRCASVHRFTAAAALEIESGPVTPDDTDASNGFGSVAFSGLPSAARLYFRALGKEANTTTGLTVSANFTAITGTRSRNNAAAVIVRGEFRINTSTGETSNPTLAVSGDTAGVFVALREVQKKIVAAAGSYAVTGQAAVLKVGKKLTAAAGIFNLTGVAAALKRGYVLTASVGSFILSGIAADLRAARILTAAAGSFVLTGIAATVGRGLTLVASVGSFVLTGIAATLTYVSGSTYTLLAEAGSFTLTGIDAALKYGRNLTAAAGSFLLSGQSASLSKTYKITAGTGAFLLTGIDAGVRHNRILIAQTGAFSFTGQVALLLRGYTLVANTGVFNLVGKAANLITTRILRATTGAFTLTGQSAGLTYEEETVPEPFGSGVPTGIGTIQIPNPAAYASIDDWAKTLTEVLTEMVRVLQDPSPAPPYEVATLPDPMKGRFTLITVVDEAGGEVLAYSDTVNWRRVSDGAIVS